jgi:hypothetical protein
MLIKGQLHATATSLPAKEPSVLVSSDCVVCRADLHILENSLAPLGNQTDSWDIQPTAYGYTILAYVKYNTI